MEDRVSLALANARQLLTIVRTAYPDFDSRSSNLDNCEDGMEHDVDVLRCLWHRCVASYRSFNEGEGSPDLALASLLKVCMDLSSPFCACTHRGVSKVLYALSRHPLNGC